MLKGMMQGETVGIFEKGEQVKKQWIYCHSTFYTDIGVRVLSFFLQLQLHNSCDGVSRNRRKSCVKSSSVPVGMIKVSQKWVEMLVNANEVM